MVKFFFVCVCSFVCLFFATQIGILVLTRYARLAKESQHRQGHSVGITGSRRVGLSRATFQGLSL